MPKIEEYLPTVSASGPAGNLDPNLEAVSQGGHGIQSFGRDIADANTVLQERIGQMESSDAAAKVADLRDKYTETIQNQTADGTIDVQQLKDQYQNEISELANSYDSPSGKDTFNRQSARLGGMLALRAVRGQTVVATNNAKSDFESFMNTNANTLRDDPSQFADVYDSTMEHLSTLQGQGLIPASEMPKVIQNVKGQFAMSAVSGQAQINPKVAQQELDSGKYNEFLSPEQLQTAYGHVKTAQTASDIETERAYRLTQQAQQQATEKWEQGALPRLVKNGLGTKDVLDSPMTAEQKYKWLGMLQTAQKQELNVDPALRNSLYTRMLLPDGDKNKISDPSQLQPYVVAAGQGGRGISPTDLTQMTTWFDKTPQGQALQANRKSVLDLAKASLVQKQGAMGASDPDGQLAVMQFTNHMQMAEANARAKGESVADLYNVNSKNFIGNQIKNFIVTPGQRMQTMSDRMAGTFTPTQPADQAGTDQQGNGQPGEKAPPPQKRIKVTDPKGRKFTIPFGQADQAKSQGFTVDE